MIPPRAASLPPATKRQLHIWQREVDAAPTYADRVTAAEALFTKYKRRAAFRPVRTTLEAMCHGVSRCAYCEDSVADEVEHIKPESIYPEACFAWMNYLFACGPCNSRKNRFFAVFAGAPRAVVSVARQPKAPVTPPVQGDPVFLNPRIDDPLRFIRLDIVSTFWFLPSFPKGTEEHARAEYTIDRLGLNKREYLPKARKQAYSSYRARLKEYVAERDKGAPNRALKKLVMGVRGMDHPAVWLEMKRCAPRIPELRELFGKAPEALHW